MGRNVEERPEKAMRCDTAYCTNTQATVNPGEPFRNGFGLGRIRTYDTGKEKTYCSKGSRTPY